MEKNNSETLEAGKNVKEVTVVNQPCQEEMVSPITTFELGGDTFPVSEEDEVELF